MEKAFYITVCDAPSELEFRNSDIRRHPRIWGIPCETDSGFERDQSKQELPLRRHGK